MSGICLISDLHLSVQHPKTRSFFLDFLAKFEQETEKEIKKLFILGDFFEFWLGDDTLSKKGDLIDDPLEVQEIFDALRELIDSGVSVSFCVGNRDFLLTESFLSSWRIRLYAEGSCLDQDLYPDIWVMHGDSLCLNDIAYAQWYAQCRSFCWQKEFLSQPLETRWQIAQLHREKSQTRGFYHQDIDELALAQWREKTITQKDQTGVDVRCLIHGHTHLSGIKNYDWGTRVTLPDWNLDAQDPRFGWAIVLPQTRYLMRFFGDKTQTDFF